MLPLKDTVVFPYIILPLSVGRDKSVLAVDRALAESRVIMLVAQRDGALDNPGEADLYPLGTAAVIMRMLKLPDGRIRILVQGLARAKIVHISQTEPYLQAKIERLEEPAVGEAAPGLEIEALVRSVKENLDRAVALGKGISPEVMVIAANLEDPGRLADLAASNLDLKLDEAQEILETDRSDRAPEAGQRPAGARDPGAHHAAGDLVAGARRDGQEPARVLPAPAAQGDPAGARRRARSSPRRSPPTGA